MEATFSTPQLCEWLKRVGFEGCTSQVRSRGLTGVDMLLMNDERLEKELQMSDSCKNNILSGNFCFDSLSFFASEIVLFF
jgi:hypothetical protein